jgi:two-component system OmpR family sensor kinase
MSIRSLRARVTCWYVGLLAAALVVFGASLYFGFKRYLDTAMEQSLAAEATSIGQTFVSELENKDPAWMSGELSESYPPENGEHFVRISRMNPDGGYEVIYQSADARELALGPLRFAGSSSLRNSRVRVETGSRDQNVVLYSLPYKLPSGTKYLIETGTTRGQVERLLSSLLTILLTLTPLVLLGAAIGGYLMMSQPLKPVVSLTLKAERIGIGEPGERLPVIRTGDELERLSLSLNRMISRLEDALAHNRRFSADVSHELRTPLTILRGELEHVIQLQNVGPDVAESVGSALEEIDRLAQIVESLLTISHLDTGGAGIEFNRFDLQEMVKTTSEQMKLLADEKQITMSSDTSEPVYSLGDESRIKQVLVNLLDNAIKYSHRGGHVVISVRSDENAACLTVKDDGAGIPPNALAHVFERFYRAEKARPRGTAGAGLGLSIVEAVCRAHGGTVSVDSTEGKGTTVEVRLPAAVLTSSPAPQDQQAAVS